ncbi:MAG: protein kinase domain-containing protein [Acidimicrobiales bacterium]
MPSDNQSYFLQGSYRRLEVTAGELLGRGRAAEVYAVSDPAEAAPLALKMFGGPVPDEAIRLVDFAQLRHLDQLVASGVSEDDSFPLVACPKCLVYEAADSTTPIGLAVLRTDTTRFLPLSSWLVSSRVQQDLRFATIASIRLAEAVEAVHSCGFVIGDVSGANVLIDSDGFCNLIDVDSFGVAAPGGGLILRPRFVTSNFFAPELPTEGPSLASDRFSLAMIITQLLLGGVNPFGGSHISEARDSVQANITAHDSWLFDPDSFNLPSEQGQHVGLSCLPLWTHDLVERALTGPAADRPPAGDWRVTLLRASTQTEACTNCGSERFRAAVCRSCGDGWKPARGNGARRRQAAASTRPAQTRRAPGAGGSVRHENADQVPNQSSGSKATKKRSSGRSPRSSTPVIDRGNGSRGNGSRGISGGRAKSQANSGRGSSPRRRGLRPAAPALGWPGRGTWLSWPVVVVGLVLLVVLGALLLAGR